MLNRSQYATTRKYDARIYLTKTFDTSPESRSKWLFDFLPKIENIKILELGCGTGIFWLANKDTIPKSWEIVLTDYSEGMLKATKKALSKVKYKFKYTVVDAQAINFPDNSFDVIIANNMLYHLDDRDSALAQIKRVLTADGTFIATTAGNNDMKELNEILYSYLDTQGRQFRFKERSFSLENGLTQLKKHFENVALAPVSSSLRIDEIEPIIEYYRSFNEIVKGFVVLDEDEAEAFQTYLNRIIESEGYITVTKEVGAFICHKE